MNPKPKLKKLKTKLIVNSYVFDSYVFLVGPTF